jgi:hypothetical protein
MTMKETDMEIVTVLVAIVGTEEVQEAIEVDQVAIEDEEVRGVVIGINLKSLISCVIVNCMWPYCSIDPDS